MLKINYPKDRNTFIKKYLAVFDENVAVLHSKFNHFLDNDGKPLKDVLKVISYKGTLLNEATFFEYILIASFEEITKIIKDVNANINGYVFWNHNKDELIKIFHYGGQKLPKNESHYISKRSSIIRDFFMVEKDLNLSTCYYCNIEYINYFKAKIEGVHDYENEIDFLLNAPKDEIEKVFDKGIRINDAISTLQSNLTYSAYTNKATIKNYLRDNPPDDAIRVIEKIENFLNGKDVKEYGLFQLDHFIAKTDYPLFALSLYNFVPSCASCNATLKGKRELINTISPTSENFKYDELVKFKLLFDSIKNKDKKGNLINTQVKLRYLSPTKDNYEEYEKVFKTNDRYVFHNRVVKELLEKKQRYPKSKIKRMAKMLKMSPKQVEKDIFGKELFDDSLLENKPFTKLKRDIW